MDKVSLILFAASLLMLACVIASFTVFFVSRKRIIDALRKNLSQKSLKEFNLLPGMLTRYAKWAAIYSYISVQGSDYLKERLKRFRRAQHFSSAAFFFMLAYFILLVWFYK